MAKKLKFHNAILCEHVVSGPNKKPTLINVFSGDVIVAELPATLTLGLYVEMAAGSPESMTVELQFDGQVFARLDAKFPFGDAERPANLILPLVQTEIDRDLTFSVIATAEGYARTTLLEKRFYKGPVPDA